MKTKKILALIASLTVIGGINTGCGKSQYSQIVNFKVDNSRVDDFEKVVSDSVYEESEIMSTEPATEAINCIEARDFNDGFAWVKTDEAWCIINTDGKIVGSVSGNSGIITDFMNGYAIIAPSTTTDEDSNELMIVNTEGNVVCTVEEYDSIYDYQALEYGVIIVKRFEDTFERSGTFYYALNVETGEAKSFPVFSGIPAGWSEGARGDYEIYLDEYLGNGYYSCFTDEKKDNLLKLQFYNSVTNEIYDIENDMEKLGFNMHNVGSFTSFGKRFVEESAYRINSSVAYIDFSKKSVMRVAEGNYHVFDVADNEVILINGDNTYLDTAEADAVDAYCSCNLETNEITKWNPKVNYGWKYVTYKNGRIAITTRNEVKSDYITVIGEDMQPIFEPIKISFPNNYSDHYISYVMSDNYIYIQNNDDYITTVVNLETGEKTEFSSSSIKFADQEHNLIFFNDTCYDTLTNEALPLPGCPSGIESDGYIRYDNKFYDRSGTELIIVK